MIDIQKRDDELCRKLGWPTVTQQKAHWNKEDQDTIVATLDSLSKALRSLTSSVEGLLAICRDQQTQINNLNERLK